MVLLLEKYCIVFTTYANKETVNALKFEKKMFWYIIKTKSGGMNNMALINCPECGGQVSDKANACPHCGFDIASYVNAVVECPECGSLVSNVAESCPNCGYVLAGAIKEVVTAELVEAATNNVVYADTVNTVSSVRNLYDVMLVDYENNIFTTASSLKDVLDCSYLEAIKLLSTSPTYIYNDISYDDAVYICRQCQNLGMRTALYTPDNQVTYFAPVDYIKPLPTVTHVKRRPYISKRIVRKAYVKPLPRPARKTTPASAAPKHSAVTHKPTASHNTMTNHKPAGSNHSSSNRPGNNHSTSNSRPGNGGAKGGHNGPKH